MKKKTKMKNKQKQKQKQKQSVIVNIDNSRNSVARKQQQSQSQKPQQQPTIIPQPIYIPQYVPPERPTFREQPEKAPVFNINPPIYNPPVYNPPIQQAPVYSAPVFSAPVYNNPPPLVPQQVQPNIPQQPEKIIIEDAQPFEIEPVKRKKKERAFAAPPPPTEEPPFRMNTPPLERNRKMMATEPVSKPPPSLVTAKKEAERINNPSQMLGRVVRQVTLDDDELYNPLNPLLDNIVSAQKSETVLPEYKDSGDRNRRVRIPPDSSRRCQATTAGGYQCSNKALDGQMYCGIHQRSRNIRASNRKVFPMEDD